MNTASEVQSRLSGVIPPMLTPFKHNGDLDIDMHIRNMGRWAKKELGGYLVLGSNGESAYLSNEEKLRLIETSVHLAGGRLVLAGTGMESTRDTIRLTNSAAKLGVDAALVLTPCYYGGQMDDAALVAHFSEVADQAEIPILIYNVPKFTHVNISTGAVARLSKHPNIIGMKDSTGDVPRLASLMAAVSGGFRLIVGTASAWYPALMLGLECGILALANIAPDECARVQQWVRTGDIQAARDLYQRMLPVNAAVTNKFGVAGLKYAADLLGYEGGSVRLPLQPLGESDKEEVRGLINRAGLPA